MTEQQEEELPIAAYEVESKDGEISFISDKSKYEEVNKKWISNKLYRAKDVEQLIKDKIKEREKHEDLPDREGTRVLKQLLEEVQNQ